MSRFMFLLYGIVCYSIFFVTFCYAIGFVNGLLVPTSIDSEPTAPFGRALVTNLLLLSLFAVQHSVMARPAFKRWWTRFVPEPIERATFVLLASLCLILLFWKWEPMGGVIWSVTDPLWSAVITGVSIFGFGIVLVSTFLINHFDLFGLRQVYMYFLGKEYKPLQFRTPAIYKSVRHPIYMGFMIAFWAAPTMTVAHLIFAVMTTGYMLVGIQLEERDLIHQFGDRYRKYKKMVPMLIPFLGRKAKADELAAELRTSPVTSRISGSHQPANPRD